MFEIEVTYRDGKPVEKLTCTSAYCELGRARTGLIRLRGWKVAPVHARIEHSLAGLFVEDVSRGYEVLVNGRQVSRHGPLMPEDQIAIGGYLVRVKALQPLAGEEETLAPLAATEVAEVARSEDDQERYKAFMEWAQFIQTELFRALDLRRMNLDSMDHDQVRETLSGLIDEILQQVGGRLPATLDTETLRKIVLDEAIGLGPLEDLIADKSVS